MYSRIEIDAILKNCRSISDVLQTKRVMNYLNEEYAQELHNVKYLSVIRIKNLKR